MDHDLRHQFWIRSPKPARSAGLEKNEKPFWMSGFAAALTATLKMTEAVTS